MQIAPTIIRAGRIIVIFNDSTQFLVRIEIFRNSKQSACTVHDRVIEFIVACVLFITR